MELYNIRISFRPFAFCDLLFSATIQFHFRYYTSLYLHESLQMIFFFSSICGWFQLANAQIDMLAMVYLLTFTFCEVLASQYRWTFQYAKSSLSIDSLRIHKMLAICSSNVLFVCSDQCEIPLIRVRFVFDHLFPHSSHHSMNDEKRS